jgi:mycoredoxin
MAGRLELYGAQGCPYTAELRERLEWDGLEFVEHDVEADAEAFARLGGLTGGQSTVPVLVEDGRVVEVGWQGRSCMAAAPAGAAGRAGAIGADGVATGADGVAGRTGAAGTAGGARAEGATGTGATGTGAAGTGPAGTGAAGTAGVAGAHRRPDTGENA